jgi:hypothetical protein
LYNKPYFGKGSYDLRRAFSGQQEQTGRKWVRVWNLIFDLILPGSEK